MKNKKNLKERGITLIALVVTIVVLLILAGVTINAVFSDSGIIKKAQEAQNKANESVQKDMEQINALENWLNENTGESNNDKEVNISTLVGKEAVTKNTKAVDAYENKITIPKGFKVLAHNPTSSTGAVTYTYSGDNIPAVQDGIVIEDKDGNQFVWVPVSNKNGDGSNKIVKDDGSEVEITLGRYTFARSSPGTPAIKQKGSEYDQTTLAQATSGTLNTKYGVAKSTYYFYELNGSRPGKEKSDLTGTNTTAKNLKDFIEKTESNKGFYIARYEASYGSGYNSSGTDTATKFANAKPLSKVSTANSTSSMNYKEGTLWNFITQPQAALVSQNMYKNDKYVESDLINSYAWSTALEYINKMGSSDYINKKNTVTSILKTGQSGDKACNIYDMSGNISEWTTETATNSTGKCTYIGGGIGQQQGTAFSRYVSDTVSKSNSISFRVIMYIDN